MTNMVGTKRLAMDYQLAITHEAAANRIVQAKLAPTMLLATCYLLLEPPKGGV